MKKFYIDETNRVYFESFKQSKFPDVEYNGKQYSSYNQYKSTIRTFLKYLGRDVATVRSNEIDDYLSRYSNQTTRANKAYHLKTFLSHLVKENVNNIKDKIDREVLIKLLSM